jgi:hypothetical protein
MSRLRQPTPTPTRGMLTDADRRYIADALTTKPTEITRMVIHERVGVKPFFHSECDYSWEIYDREAEIKWTLDEIERKLKRSRVANTASGDRPREA